ncbi:MATE family efflux transporter [Phaeobacter gallaeciensis]|uniref:DNA-damage-inducible protein F n=1 Tax=Phaeobacter gallaeciensis TaxID=60890 RepID=A0AAC9Z9F9_9RHOB|nr:MATE family efflux transporter [Phaeobacter gallaeciensis]AHD09941.1 putative efflux protein, MATE family [Phaeobacter gallaeciensis DSM 26640]ATE93205.1 DNA-damage-inducible protein F [Phaeobacter gallaeciensis]ATE96973.1 DNA-damage-inducible protein F [Phaeobacter gallaeciensis]ATF01870.1 DNA-damage-inducible protein F [Phaeobacter gallaeciensis]ATF06250.1 DNA-damage-inducible protein F [Phaeobacter gallaeciensis]
MSVASQNVAEPITHRRVLKIALPIVLSNATVPILGAVDTGVVGQMGQAAPIGAVGIGAVILATIYWIFGFLRMGTTGLAAQARGAGDSAETGALLTRGILLAFAAGAVFIIGQVAVFWGAFALAPASAEVEGLARDYLEIRIWGAPATIALYAVTGWLIAVERTRGVFLLQIWMNGLNILLDLWFVLALGWGVEGVAVATLIAEWTGLALGLWLCRDAFAGSQWRNWARVFDPVRLKRMMQVNGDIMIRSVLLTGSFTTFLFIGADLGDVTLAANQVLLQFVEITAFALDGFAFSAEALVGSAVGAKARMQLRRAAVVASQWGVGGAIALGLLFWLGGGWLIDVMSTSEEVRAAGRDYLIWAAILPLISVASYMFDGIYIGATWTRDMRIAMLQSVAIYAVALVVLVPMLGNHGLWAALMVLNLARGTTLGLRYPRLEAQVGS